MATKYKVISSTKATRDLLTIFSYIEHASGSTSIAFKIMNSLEHAIRSLDEMPTRCSLSPIPLLAERGYHHLPIMSYIVLFLVDEENKTVTVMRVFHGRRDYAKYL